MQGNWIAANWWQLLLAASLIVGYIVALAININETRQLKDDIRVLREGHSLHINSTGLHRGPDFELRMMNVEHQLETVGKHVALIGNDVKEILFASKREK